ncbi:GNAT family N-acetyltransferase [Paraburkholderia acidisoli]|uniref:GNAT family N-acetyltransferase n=1 Tax=Paraburkholderia acidisoli TaxID=2571748 RepID=A0A7Z2GLI1_9BURK|nr:GNAT family N-acetyltransferase [Paraburkholderia acidisoli]QGZ63764.1 GNAT family N-acetyltransferase [Paraburkholderia acidisoli]
MNEPKPTPFTIRPLIEQDAAAFHAMRLHAAQNYPAGIVPTYEEEAAYTHEQNVARVRTSETQIVFGAFDGETLVGIAGLMRNARQKEAHKAFIWGVFVDPAYRRTGLGRQLLVRAIAEARERGVMQVNLVVSSQNPRAQALYRSLGFVRYGVEPRGLCIAGEYVDDELMVCFLDDPAVPD